jgi:hypothetical protein
VARIRDIDTQLAVPIELRRQGVCNPLNFLSPAASEIDWSPFGTRGYTRNEGRNSFVDSTTYSSSVLFCPFYGVTHIAEIEEHGRMGWQRRSGYNRRSLLETVMYRYKTVVGRRLHAWTLPNQQTEVKIECSVLNRMTTLGMPATVRIR